jgi:hypothetical protein
MLKKTQLSEKLKKLKIEGASHVGSDEAEPIVQGQKNEVEKSEVKKPPVGKLKDQKPKQARPKAKKTPKEEPILQSKKATEIDEKKPDEFIESLFPKKQTLTFISDLAIPAQKLSKLFRIETSYTEVALTQILTAWKDSEKIIKWTAKLDKHGQEFYSLKGEGLMKMKDNPPVYGMEFDDGAIISTHIGEYTFIMGCYNFDVKTLVKIFAYGLENAKRFNL